MKKYDLLFMVFLFAFYVNANNVVKTVSQVSSAVVISDNVDYHITSAIPFTTTGSINITDTDNAVLILDSIRPSVAKNQLGYININGQAAVAGTNCVVKFYRSGSIIMPHGDNIKPLTVYTSKNYLGSSTSDFSVGSKIDLSKDWDNKIESFKLKRGYMLFVSTKKQGYGWNRLFIADKSDREISVLQGELLDKISCIRISKWFDADKRGVACWDPVYNVPLNTTWCYNWDAGINNWEDREYVTQHHHIGWPSITAVGDNGTSPNILTNNEPDQKPNIATVEQVLASWPEVMAQGKRIGSPAVASNYTWLKTFIDSIDARGWRCDFLAIHAYWYSDYWLSTLSHYSDMCSGRSLWLTEMNYGANWTGWPGDSTTASAANYSIEMKHMGPILTKLMSAEYVERIAPYNWVQGCRTFINTSTSPATLTPIGEFYSKMEAPIAYDASTEFRVNPPRLDNPSSLVTTYLPISRVVTMSWTDTSGEFLKSMVIERRLGDNGSFETIDTIHTDENTTSFSYRDSSLASIGNYTYRIHCVTYNGCDLYSNYSYCIINNTRKSDSDIQYGSISASNTSDSYVYFEEPYSVMPVVVCGGVTNRNANLAPVEHVYSSYKISGKYAFFKFNFFPWTLSYYQTFYQTTNPSETSNFIVANPGNGYIGKLAYEAGYIHSNDSLKTNILVGADTVSFSFDKPFDEGTTPVVFVTPKYLTATNKYPYMWRVWDVTNKGFKVVLQRQAGITSYFSGQDVAYFAVQQGKTIDGEDNAFTIGSTDLTFTSGVVSKKISYGDTLRTPVFYAQMQTLNRHCAGLLRYRSLGPDSTYETIRLQLDSTDINNSITNSNIVTENIGYIVVSSASKNITNSINEVDSENKSAIVQPYVATTAVLIKDNNAKQACIYGASGTLVKKITLVEGQLTVDVSSLNHGIFIVRTDVGHTAKFIIK